MIFDADGARPIVGGQVIENITGTNNLGAPTP